MEKKNYLKSNGETFIPSKLIYFGGFFFCSTTKPTEYCEFCGGVIKTYTFLPMGHGRFRHKRTKFESTKSILVLELTIWLCFSTNSRVVQNKFIIQFLDNLILSSTRTRECGTVALPPLQTQQKRMEKSIRHAGNANTISLGCYSERTNVRKKKNFALLNHIHTSQRTPKIVNTI